MSNTLESNLAISSAVAVGAVTLTEANADTKIEREKKWLVNAASIPEAILNGVPRQEISQAYLRIDSDVEERIRRVVEDGITTYFFTRKEGKGEARKETEHTIKQAEFNILSNSVVGNWINKVRYKISTDDLIYELDVYTEKLQGLVVVEVEFKDETQSATFTPPDWFGSEVTEDKRFKNQQLALKGIPVDETLLPPTLTQAGSVFAARLRLEN